MNAKKHVEALVKFCLIENKNLVGALISGYGLMVLTMIIQFVLVPLYLRSMGKEVFGVLTMLLASINYASVGSTWLSGGMARILGERGAANDMAGLAEAYSFSKCVFAVYAIIAIALFWLLAPWVLTISLVDEEMHQAMIYISVYFMLLYEYNADRLAFNALCRQASGNIIEAAGQVVFAASVAVGLYLEGGIISVIIALIAGVISTRIFAGMYWYRHNIALGWRWVRWRNIEPMWQRISGTMGRHYVVYGVLLLTLQADILIVGWLASPEIAATYYLVWRIPEVCILLLGRLPGVFAPHIIQMDARGNVEEIQLIYRKGLRIMLALSALAGLAYALLGNWFVNLWVGDDAPVGLLPYVLAGASLFFVASIQWPAHAAYALVKTSLLVKVTALYLIVKLSLIALLFPEMAYMAPLVAIITSHVLGVFILYLKIGKEACKIEC